MTNAPPAARTSVQPFHTYTLSHTYPLPPRSAAAVKAIQKVEKVRSARQDRFHEARMQKAKATTRAAERRQLEQEIHLVRAPGALAKDKAEKLKGERVARVGGWVGEVRWDGLCLVGSMAGRGQ